MELDKAWRIVRNTIVCAAAGGVAAGTINHSLEAGAIGVVGGAIGGAVSVVIFDRCFRRAPDESSNGGTNNDS